MGNMRTLKLFNNGDVPPAFIQDMTLFLNMNSDLQKEILHLIYEMDTADTYGPAGQKIIDRYNIPENNLTQALRSILFIFSQLTTNKLSKSELTEEISQIFPNSQARTLSDLINKAYDDNLIKRFNILAYRTEALSFGLSRFTSAGMLVDQRFVRNDKYELLEKLPMVILEIRHSIKEKGEEKIAIQFTLAQFEFFLKDLTETLEKTRKMMQINEKSDQ